LVFNDIYILQIEMLILTLKAEPSDMRIKTGGCCFCSINILWGKL